MDYLGLKDSSHDFLANCVISFFRLHLVLHACVARFDVTSTVQNFLDFEGKLNGASVHVEEAMLKKPLGHLSIHRSQQNFIFKKIVLFRK